LTTAGHIPDVASPRGIATDPLIQEARRRARRRRLAMAALAIVAIGCAGAAYLRSAGSDPAVNAARPGHRLPSNGALTILWKAHAGVSVSALGAGGQLHTVYRCGVGSACAAPASIAWAPDGRRVALSFVAFGGLFPDVGLHIVDVATGVDRRIPFTTTNPPNDAWFLRARRRLGCSMPAELAWSPDGSTLAYRCTDSSVRGVQLLRVSGGRRRTIIGHAGAFWPTWSPDGRRIAYSTTLLPHGDSRIYTVSLDGSRRRLVARHGAAPVWSPDGRAIAFEARCGIRMVTPRGRDVTPPPGSAACGIGRTGRPVWSPDGTQLAISDDGGTYTMAADGTGVQELSRHTGRTVQGSWPMTDGRYNPEPGRAAWQPKP
jgi:WD40 repeat protein